ncbi:MAG: DNA-directed RNA polymerase subunit alpha [Elusimicrobiota bacterium]
MEIRDFKIPTKIKWQELDDKYGKLAGEPFEKGYGHTIGNSLRRILLSSMEGAVITSLKIDGAPHEFSSIEGIKEDVIEIIFNLKQLRFKLYNKQPQRITLNYEGKGEVKGADFKLNESIKLMNPDAHIATLNENAKLNMEVVVESGRGYVPASERQDDVSEIGVIPVDAAFSPVKKVNYDVEIARVGQDLDYDRLVLEVWTDGSINPPEAVAYASEILKETTEAFKIPGIEVELGPEEEAPEEIDESMLKLPVQELDLSTRLCNILKASKVKTLGELAEKTEEEIKNMPGLGDKYMNELREKMEKFNKEKESDIQLCASDGGEN